MDLKRGFSVNKIDKMMEFLLFPQKYKKTTRLEAIYPSNNEYMRRDFF